MSAASDPPPPQLTPKGTNIVIVPATQGQPQQTASLPAELVPVFQAALQAMPPGALKKYWGYVLALLVPLALTTYTNLKQIWEGPAQVAAIKQEYADDHKEVEELKKRFDTLDAKLDKVLWIINRSGPTSGPHNF